MIVRIVNLYIERWDFFSKLLIEHITLTLISIFFITAIGLVMGVIMTRNRVFAKIILAITNFLYTIPSIALFGFLVIITGIGDKSAILALVIYGLLPVIKNTYVGINEVDDQIIESAVGMGSTDIQLLFKVQLPLALPVIFAGFRTMVIMTIALCGIASFIGAGGLGVAIWRGITTNFPEMTIAGSLLVALLAIITDYIFEFVEKKMKKRILGIESN
jgi:osmoprotectant transport system permease protein